jgi:hypothetical protein
MLYGARTVEEIMSDANATETTETTETTRRGQGPPKTERLNLRLTSADRAVLDRAAEALSLSMNDCYRLSLRLLESSLRTEGGRRKLRERMERT